MAKYKITADDLKLVSLCKRGTYGEVSKTDCKELSFINTPLASNCAIKALKKTDKETDD